MKTVILPPDYYSARSYTGLGGDAVYWSSSIDAAVASPGDAARCKDGCWVSNFKPENPFAVRDNAAKTATNAAVVSAVAGLVIGYLVFHNKK